VDDVHRATRFEVEVAEDLSPVPAPTPQEVATVREVDPLGVRRMEFDAGELARTFGHGPGLE
jgi:hypothetical protein